MRDVWTLLVALMLAAPAEKAHAGGFVCAGQAGGGSWGEGEIAAKPTSQRHRGQRGALVLFAAFADDDTWSAVPAWGAQLLDPTVPGSLSHFYDTMSFGAHRVQGESAARLYRSRHAASHYLSPDPREQGQYGEFCREVVEAADADVDFAEFDNDGPDGIASSGDDDGLVDAVFIVLARTRANFMLGPATGVSRLGNWGEYFTSDSGEGGLPTRVAAYQGTIQQGATFAEAAGSMSHEYGHVLGLPDLFDTGYLRKPDAPPEEDSAGIGAWGLMGWGTLGWNGTPGPNSLCAFSRLRLGWARELRPEGLEDRVELEQVGASGQVCRVPLSSREYLLLEYRRRSSTYYDRGIPAEGLLVWHVGRSGHGGGLTSSWSVDLECADGRWADAGFPLGENPDIRGGDNLDFWAHDAGYAARHGGNLGDATDPFDGVRHRHFTPETNPAATSADEEHGVHLEDIAIDDDRLWVQVRIEPPKVELVGVAPRGEPVAAGAPVAITFHLVIVGATPAAGLRVELRTDDDIVEVLDPVVELSSLQPEQGTIHIPQVFPQVRFPADLEREHVATVELLVFADSVLVGSGTTAVTGVPSHRVVVTVTDSGGIPLPGIRVRLEEQWGVEKTVFFERGARTDSAGTAAFHVPTGTFDLSADPPDESPWGWVGRRGLRIGGDGLYELSLPLVYELSGTVRDAQGIPISSHYVVLKQMMGDHREGSVRVSSDGTYSIKLTAGEYAVETRASLGGDPIPAQEHGSTVLAGDTALDITLAAGVGLTVNVVDEDGTGIDDVWVEAYPGSTTYVLGSQSGMTQGGEGAKLGVMPGPYTVTLGRVPVPYLPLAGPTQATVLGDTSLTLVLDSGLHLTGELVDEFGVVVEYSNPYGETIGSVELSALDGGPSYSAVLGLRRGEFTVGVTPGRYRVQVRVHRSMNGIAKPFPSQDLGEVQVRSDTTVALAVHPGVSVRGWVYGQYGDSRTSKQVYLQTAAGLGGQGYLEPDGSFAVLLAPGVYTARAQFWDGELNAPSQILGTVGVTQDTVFVWQLMQDEVVEGRLISVHGENVERLQIHASSKVDSLPVSIEATPWQDGSFAIRLPPGRYSVRLRRPLSWGSSVQWYMPDLEVPPLEPPVYVLPGGVRLRTVVTDAVGRAVPAAVALRRGPFSLRNYLEQTPAVAADLTTRGQYEYEFELSPGRYSAVVSLSHWDSTGIYSRVVSELLAEDEPVLHAALPAPQDTGRLTGTVTDAAGAALTGATLYAYEPGQSLLATRYTQGGEYELALPPGVYEMAARTHSQEEGQRIYELGRVEVKGDRSWDIVLGDPTAVEGGSDGLPHRFALEQNYPNPFNAGTVIRFALESAGFVEVTVYDLLGQNVRTLAREWRTAGAHAARWDGRDDDGGELASGVYLYRLQAGEQVEARKLVLVR